MTRIEFDEKTLTLEIKGHAGYGKMGQDIICAAVSILTYTLVGALQRYSEYGWYRLEADLSGGEAYIHCAVNGYFSMVVEMFRFAMIGYKMLAEEYPQHVEVIEQGGEDDGGI